ncbi:MAG: ATP-grasp domain-containing protein [Erysipelotrichaceae bacterium]|nr:ATP-grasp domain-containing protein [Erysipelotrichaceae bacterium]
MKTIRDIHDDFLKIGRIAVLIKESKNPVYDFNFRNFFDADTIYSPVELPVLLRIGAIADYKKIDSVIGDIGMKLLVSEEEHLRCSTIERWYPLLKLNTPFTRVYETLPSIDDLQKDFSFPVFIKGNRQTSHHKRSQCIIESAEQYEALRNEWKNDPILFWQKPAIREYVPLQTVDSDSFPDMIPISHEFRFFYFKGKYMAHGPYWTMGPDYSMDEEDLEHTLNLTKWAANRVNSPFLAIDVALTAEGDWIIIEVNDGQESGLAGVNPLVLWKNVIAAAQADGTRTFFDVIKECVDRWDPYNLLGTGCPQDEFDREVQMIRERIRKDSSLDEINTAVSEVFSKQFEPEYFQPHQCTSVSNEIFEVINKNKDKIID